MGSAGGLVIVPFIFYVALTAPFCVKVGDASSWKVSWMRATALTFSPLTLLIAFYLP